jgi:hypothetical protein
MLGQELPDHATDYVLQTARHVVDSFGLRPPASHGEQQTQRFLRDELDPVTDGPVRIESFPVARKAFFAVPGISGLLVMGAIVCWWVSPWLALVMSAAAVLTLACELGLYWQMIDPFFPKGPSHNLLGTQRPSGAISRRLVLNAHVDAAYEWRWHYRFPGIFPLIVRYAFASVAMVFCIDVAAVVLECSAAVGTDYRTAVGLIQTAFVPGAFIGIWFTSFRHVSPGANDDLSGALIVVGMAKFLRASGIRLENTELVYLITGAEEAGLRGAKAFTCRHRNDWKDVPTVVVTLDTIRDLKHLHVYSRDRNGTVPHDPAVCRWLHDAGRRCGLELGYASVYLGSTDATAFTLAGIRAAALCAMDPRPAEYYHNRRDRPDNMSRECIQKTIEIVLEGIRQYDQHGLAAES